MDFRSSAQGQVQVTAADPALAEQGTVNLNVKVTGKGFKNGAKAKWFVTGTTDTGGVTVNSTTFVSTTEVTANITVADTAVISNFDIQVLNSDGRGGKGTELFKVTSKNAGNCPPQQPSPTGDTSCYAALPGCLDSSFGGDGFVNYSLGYPGATNWAWALVVQPDGKIVTAGDANTASNGIDFVVARFNGDGSLDTSFGDPDTLNPTLRRGYTVTTITAKFDYARAMVLQPDGKIVVHGTTSDGMKDNVVLVRYNTDGTLDPSFGSGGIVTLGRTRNTPYGDVAVQSDGRIVVGGTTENKFALARLLSNGSLDVSFGSAGLVLANPNTTGGSAVGLSLAIQRVPAYTGEERIVVGGYSLTSSNAPREWTLMRFKANGATDLTFGTAGVVKTLFSGFGDTLKNVDIDYSNRIVAGGQTYNANSICGSYVIDFAIARYTENGSLDSSFAGGTQTVNFFGGRDEFGERGLAVQPDNKILAFGYPHSSDGTMRHFGLVRLNNDGTRDSSFGLLSSGLVTTEIVGQRAVGIAVGLDPTNGKIVAAGGATPSTDLFMGRYWP
jgi:uncharacterized delta-60 repeat protein